MKTKPKNEIDYSLMRRLEKLRKALKKTRQQVSDELDGAITVDQLKSYELESRYSEPPYKHLTMLARYYGVSTDYLLGTTDEPDGDPLPISKSVVNLIRVFDPDELDALDWIFTPDEDNNAPLIFQLVTLIHKLQNNASILIESYEQINKDAREALSTGDDERLNKFITSCITYAERTNSSLEAILYRATHLLEEYLLSITDFITLEDLLEDDILEEIEKRFPDDNQEE